MVKTVWKKIKFSPGNVGVEPCQEWTFHTKRCSRTAYISHSAGWLSGGEHLVGWKNADWWGASYWQNDTWYKGHCAFLSCAPANLGYEMVHIRRQMRGLNSFLHAYQESVACVWVKARGSWMMGSVLQKHHLAEGLCSAGHPPRPNNIWGRAEFCLVYVIENFRKMSNWRKGIMQTMQLLWGSGPVMECLNDECWGK